MPRKTTDAERNRLADRTLAALTAIYAARKQAENARHQEIIRQRNECEAAEVEQAEGRDLAWLESMFRADKLEK